MIGRSSVSAALDILRAIDRRLSQGAVENARDAMTEAARRRVASSLLAGDGKASDEHERAKVTELPRNEPERTQTARLAREHVETSTAGSE
jgi:hypothetical protein